MKSILPTLLAGGLAISLAAPVAAAPRTIVCGPFPFVTSDARPREIGPVTLIIDAEQRKAEVVGRDGQPIAADLDELTQHRIAVKFSSVDLTGDYGGYVVAIDNNQASATLATSNNTRNPFSKGGCRPSARLVH